MPKGPRGEKRPGDVIGAAIMVAKVATGEIEEVRSGADPQRDGGKKGGVARAQKLSKDERVRIARAGAKARWQKPD